MKDYQIRPIALRKTTINSMVTKLVKSVFKLADITEEKIRLNTDAPNGRSLYLGAFHDDKLVAFNGFIAHELQYNDQTYIAHQSCWTATHPLHRKQGLFSSLINTAKEILREQGSQFILGYPNQYSYPIMTKRLGFRAIEMKKLNIPTFLLPSLSLKFYLAQLENINVNNAFLPIQADLIGLKRQEFGEAIKVFGAYNNIIWGKTKHRRIKGVLLKFFLVGGISINKPHLFSIVLQEIVQKEKVHFIQFVGNMSNTYWQLFKGVTNAPDTEPLVIFDLNSDTSTANFNFFTGLKDVF